MAQKTVTYVNPITAGSYGNALAKLSISVSTQGAVTAISEIPETMISPVSLDSFQRMRVSQPQALLQSDLTYGLDFVDMEYGATGTGVSPTHDIDKRAAVMTVNAGSGTCFSQSFNYLPYQPGRSHAIFATFIFAAPLAGVVQEIGYFDSSNGIILRQNGTSGVEFVRRSSVSGIVVETVVPQNVWNNDKLDGTGASGVTLDPTKAQILFIDLQYLGMGRVRCGFDINGDVIVAHSFLHANNLDEPYMQSGSLPVQALVTAVASAAPSTMFLKCCAVFSEGTPVNIPSAVTSTRNISITAANGARTHAFSLRPRALFNGFVNRTVLVVNDVSMLVTGNNAIFYEICYGANFSVAPTFTNVDATYSSVEVGTGGTFLNLTGGTVLASGFLPSSSQTKSTVDLPLAFYYPLTLNRAGATRALGTLTVLVTGLGAASACNFAASLYEFR